MKCNVNVRHSVLNVRMLLAWSLLCLLSTGTVAVADTQSVTTDPGIDQPAAVANQNGATGGNSSSASAITPAGKESESPNSATATSGRGGTGGTGESLTQNGVGTTGGKGGNAGNATASANSTKIYTPQSPTFGDAIATANGGIGGVGGRGGSGKENNGGQGGDGGNGGDTKATAAAEYSKATANGGQGGIGGDGGGYGVTPPNTATKGSPGKGGGGGSAEATSTGVIGSQAYANGGHGGNAGPGNAPGGMVGGQGGNAIATATATTGDNNFAWATATGGDGGKGISQGDAGFGQATAIAQGAGGSSVANAYSGHGIGGQLVQAPFTQLNNAAAKAITTNGKSANATADSSALTVGRAGARAESNRVQGDTTATSKATAGKEFGAARAESTANTAQGTATSTATADVNGRGLGNATAKATANGTTTDGKAVSTSTAADGTPQQFVKQASISATAPTKSIATTFTQAGLAIPVSTLPPSETVTAGRGGAIGWVIGDPLLSDVQGALAGTTNVQASLTNLIHADGLGAISAYENSSNPGAATYKVSTEFLLNSTMVSDTADLKLGMFNFRLTGQFDTVIFDIVLNGTKSDRSFDWHLGDNSDALDNYFIDNILDLGKFSDLANGSDSIEALLTLSLITQSAPVEASFESSFVLATVARVPEPPTLFLVLAGILGFFLMSRHRLLTS